MTRIISILAIAFYILVSTGVHIDVDTCCKSIAGLSLFSENGDHRSKLVEDCCALETIPSCHPFGDSEPAGCPSDCVYIQVLQLAPQASYTAQIQNTSFDFNSNDLYVQETIKAESRQSNTDYQPPASLRLEEDLTTLFHAHITYG